MNKILLWIGYLSTHSVTFPQEKTRRRALDGLGYVEVLLWFLESFSGLRALLSLNHRPEIPHACVEAPAQAITMSPYLPTQKSLCEQSPRQEVLSLWHNELFLVCDNVSNNEINNNMETVDVWDNWLEKWNICLWTSIIKWLKKE